MTDPSPQQPGYPSNDDAQLQAQQQQQAQQQAQAAAYAQQQAAYAQQVAYAQQMAQPNLFAKLPMTMLTFGLASGGLAAILIGMLVGGSKGDNPFAVPAPSIDGDLGMFSTNLDLFTISGAIAVLTAVAITTGPKYRNVYRTIVLGLTVIWLGSTIGNLIGDGVLNNADGAVVIGRLLVVIGLGLFTAATFAMKEPTAAPQMGPATGMIPQVPPAQQQQQYPQQGWQ